MRYIVARWGYSPHIAAWELWGEVNLAPHYEFRHVAAWHREMLKHIRDLDPWNHLLFTHCHNWRYGHPLWAMPDVQCVQGNGYIRPPNHTPDHVVNFRNYLDEVRQYGKPVFVAEYGGRGTLGAPSGDYLNAQMQSGLWASLLSPLSGTAMHWWWNFVDGEVLYSHYRALSNFSRDIDRLKHRFRTVRSFAHSTETRLSVLGLQAGSQGHY